LKIQELQLGQAGLGFEESKIKEKQIFNIIVSIFDKRLALNEVQPNY
jgi:hypothetical protein